MATFRELAEEMCDLANVEPPRTFGAARNSDQVGRQVLRAFNVAGRTLVGKYMWQELKTEKTVTLVDGTASYDLGERPKRIWGGFVFDDSRNDRAIIVDEVDWLVAKNGGVSNPNCYLIWPAADEINLYPTPGASPGVLKLILNSTKWVSTGGSSPVYKSQITNDDDRVRLNEMMIMLEARWRFLQIRQMPFDDARMEAFEETSRQINRNGAMKHVRFGGGSVDGINDPYPADTVSMR